jgi:hypothetical protein
MVPGAMCAVESYTYMPLLEELAGNTRMQPTAELMAHAQMLAGSSGGSAKDALQHQVTGMGAEDPLPTFWHPQIGATKGNAVRGLHPNRDVARLRVASKRRRLSASKRSSASKRRRSSASKRRRSAVRAAALHTQIYRHNSMCCIPLCMHMKSFCRHNFT